MIGLGDVRQLLTQADEHTLSLYLLVDPSVRENQASPPAWRIWLKNALKTVERDLQESQRAAWPGVRERVEMVLQTYAADAKTLALFFGADWETIYRLPLPVENQLMFGKPLLTPLLWAIDEYKPYLVTMVDAEKAHFITAYLGSAGHQDTLTLEIDTDDWREKTMRATSSAVNKLVQRSARDDFEDRLEVHTERFYREVAGRIEEMMQSHKIARLVIGGSEEAAHDVRRLLPEKAARSLVDVQAIPMRFTPNEVLKHILPKALEHERQQEMALVEAVINQAKGGGRGALGREAVLAALDQQRVELLVAPWPLSDGDLMAQLPLRALEANAALELVHGEAADRLKAEGGLAARLYYTM
ncbi:MAG: host attachment protein [Chloroflexi bacterium]|nr:host attachment protein [Chloroflexota bacterium]